MDVQTLVVGAGLSGLVVARSLAEAGHAVRVVDRGRAPGGRASTRRGRPGDPGAPGEFDHGAQYFTVRDAQVAELVQDWREAGVVAPWEGRFVTLRRGARGPDPRPGTRWVGTPRMSALARHLAAGLEVATDARIVSIERDERGWRASAEDGTVHEALERVLVAMPGPQAVPLLTARPDLARIAAAATFEPCLAVMVRFAGPLDVPFDGAFVEDSPLAWIAGQAGKPGRAETAAFVLHAGASWSRAHLDDPPDVVAELLLDALASALDRRLPPVTACATHRWLHARPASPLARGCLWEPETGFGVCGDWLLGARVEAALRSGLALADAVLGRATAPA